MSVWVEDQTNDPLDNYSIRELPLGDVDAVVVALQWAARTGRMDHVAGSLRDAAESVAESLLAIVDVALTNHRLTDKQRRDVLLSSREHLIDALDAVDPE